MTPERQQDGGRPFVNSPYIASSRPASSQHGSRVQSASQRVQSASLHSNKLLREQISRLQEQCSLLDKESKEAEVTMQNTIKQNRQTWMALKQENKQLKQQLMQRGSSTTRANVAEEQVSSSTAALEKKVHDLRRHYDKIMQDKKTTVAKLANCQDNVLELRKAVGAVGGSPSGGTTPRPASSSTGEQGSGMGPGAWGTKEGRLIRQLENRLTKAQLKANEAQSIRRMYEQVLDKVRQEQLGFGPYVQSLEAALQAKDTEHSRLTQALLEAQHAKEKAKQELSSFQAKMTTQRAARESVLQEQRAKAGTLGAANRALLAQQFGLKEAAFEAAQHQHNQQHSDLHHGDLKQTKGPLGQQGPSSQEAQDPQLQESQQQDSSSWEGEAATHVSNVEEAVQKLCEAALAPHAQAMLDCMLPRQETYASLTAMHKTVLEQEAQLAKEVEAARQALRDTQQGSRSSTTQAHLDAAQAELSVALQKAEAAKESHAKITRAYVDVRAGLEHIATMLGQLPLPPGQLPVPISEDTLGDVLAQSHQRLVSALKFIHTLPKAGALLDKLMLLESDQQAPNT
ncbi:hypothetical protein DUNSADRAFT_12633 [Dunaliella salina]|uniref:Uncharacterized protein n=1 Tax=Dunaliella salina TaxID=3046 RepID=A0ABQ7H3Q6_DUNSA|nr:hypothetical protein DUNSADRAFT_12633 [Dunaliella salina]|eukprot:KAF5841468.1 hypothetical protein DUNSADRAFT_12633 [Dunaliella salina]